MITLKKLALRLTQYDEQEARSIVRLLLADCFGWSYTDICNGVLDTMSDDDISMLESLMKRLEGGEPIQYVTGKAEFYGREFHVEPGVLIPRPETETLIDLIRIEVPQGISLLDIGTGSGCIAVTISKEIEGANVTAWDISEKALKIALDNAERQGAKISFKEQDALNAPTEKDLYDVIVSNPPYICNKEKADMDSNVLEHEPHMALFVPDDDPLLFYRKITEYGVMALKEGGLLAFEINPLYAEALCEMASDFGFQEITIHQDQYGKARCLLARKRNHVQERNV